MLGVSCSQNHIPVTRSGHLQGKKPQHSDLTLLFLALMHINYKKKYIPFCGNRPAGSRYFPLSPPSVPPPFLPLSYLSVN